MSETYDDGVEFNNEIICQRSYIDIAQHIIVTSHQFNHIPYFSILFTTG